MAALFGVVKVDAAERIGVVFVRGSRGQHDGVIGAQAGRCINGVRVAAEKQDAALDARDEEGTAAVEDLETLEVEVGAIHHVEGAGLWRDRIENVDVVQFPSETPMNVGIGPRRSSKVCSLMAAFLARKRAHGNTDKAGTGTHSWRLELE